MNKNDEIINYLINRIQNIEDEIEEIKKSKSCSADTEPITQISKFEYDELYDGLEKYNKIKELQPLVEAMRRALDRLDIWI